jgi:hypothetical protein
MLAYPRLDASTAVQLLAELSGLKPTELRNRSATEHSRVDWYPTALDRVDKSQLEKLQSNIRATAERFGHPEVRRRSPLLTKFDQAISVGLLHSVDIVPADAAHEGVWSFLSLVLVPDVAFWRFPNRDRRDDYERLLGRPRNVFRRLWWRAYALGEEASGQLHEDEAVAIMERPTLGGDIRLARMIATAHLQVIGTAAVSRTELLRQVTKRLRRLSAVITLTALDNADLSALIDEVFDMALQSMTTLPR